MVSVAADIPPRQGEIVRVRSRRYLVEAVEAAPRPGNQTLVRLSCLEDDAEGEELEVLWEKEVDAQRVSEADWSRLAQGHFDLPRHFAAYYRTLRWNTVTSTDPKLFQAPYRAGIRIDAYQLEPLRKALLLPRVSLFIADDVGLGKVSKKKKPYRYRWPDDIRDDVLGRLLELNARRAEEERLAGATVGATGSTTSRKRKSKRNADTPLLD